MRWSDIALAAVLAALFLIGISLTGDIKDDDGRDPRCKYVLNAGCPNAGR
jgi:hypothetical protein